MSTAARQKAANRRNAAHSTGPKTDEGKARSSQNATTHGLTSRTVVLPHESEAEYNQLRDQLLELHQPATDLERTYTILIAEAFWRRERMHRIETAFMASRLQAVSGATPELAGDDALVVLFTDPTEMNRLRLLLRYITAADRAHAKAVADLDKLQKQRTTEERAKHKAALDNWAAQLLHEPEPDAAYEIRFVQKNGCIGPVENDYQLAEGDVEVDSRTGEPLAA